MNRNPQFLDVEIELRQEPPRETSRLARAAVVTGAADPALVKAFPLRPRVGGGSLEEGSEEGAWKAIQDLLKGVTTRDTARTRRTMRWPLFFLGCPAAPGSELEVTFRTETSAAHGWKLNLFGSGFERSTSLVVADTHQATAAAGGQRLLFVEQVVDVVDYVLERRGRGGVRGSRVEIVPGKAAVGIMDVEGDVAPWRSPTRTLLRLPYAGASPKGKQEWSREQEYRVESDLVLGADVTPIEIGVNLSYELATTVTLRAALPGGIDWNVMAPVRCAGMLVGPG